MSVDEEGLLLLDLDQMQQLLISFLFTFTI